MNTQKLNEISQQIYEEMLRENPINRDDLTCDTTLIPDYGYDVESKEGLYIENQVNFLIGKNYKLNKKGI